MHLGTSNRLSLLAVSVIVLSCTGNASRADEWEGSWSQDCKKSYSIELSKQNFDLGAFETKCIPLGLRKMGSKVLADLSCSGEEGVHRERGEILIIDGKLNIKIPNIVDMSHLQRCRS